MCKPLVNHVCSMILEQFRKKELVFLGAPCPVLDAESRQCEESPGNGIAWRGRKSNCLGQERSDERDTVLRKPGFVFVPPSIMVQNAKRKSEVDLAELPKTASLEQVSNLMREIHQQRCVT